MSFIKRLKGYKKFVSNFESISAMLKGNLIAQKRESFFPSNYYYLTHLVNPAHTFWNKKFPDTPKSDDLARKLFLGNHLGRLASAWFRKLPKFFVEEGKLDGAFVGIPGVRGNLDFKIGDAIIEFKTKDTLPISVDDIFVNYPQDLEQLAFYSVLHPLNPRENYLVFMNNIPPYKFKAFKVITKDFGKVKELLMRRMKILNEAFKQDDCSNLGRCRYYGNDCQFEENKICKCSEMEPLHTIILRDGLDVVEDASFTQLLQSEQGKSTVPNDMFTTKDIIAPRKYLMEKKLNIEEEWKSDDLREEYSACLGNLIKKLPMQLTSAQSEQIKNSIRDPRAYIAHKWLLVKTSIKPSGEDLPYTVKVNKTPRLEWATGPGEYAIAELAIICALYGKSKGLVFTVYPILDDLVHVYEVVFNNPEEILKIIKERIDSLEKATENGEILSVEACPEFMNNNKECPLMKICHSKKGTGCVENYIS